VYARTRNVQSMVQDSVRALQEGASGSAQTG
jgi:hypothetical protein